MTVSKLFAGLILGAAASLSAAHASVIYDLNPGTTLTPKGASTAPLSFILTLDDNFVPGSFSRACNQGCYSSTGSFNDFQLSVYDGAMFLGTLNSQPDTAFEMTNGNIAGSSGQITWYNSSSDFILTFGNGAWSAKFNSDDPPVAQACYGGSCTASGSLTVSEPDVAPVLALMLLGLPVIRRRRAL